MKEIVREVIRLTTIKTKIGTVNYINRYKEAQIATKEEIDVVN